MKITRTREYTINMGNYESFKTGATVEVEVQEENYETAFKNADNLLSQALAKDIHEAAEVTMTNNSFILTMEL